MLVALVVVGASVAVLLERSGVAASSGARRVAAYEAAHAERGTLELVDTLLRQVRPESVTELGEPDAWHRVMTVQLDDGTRLSGYLRDAQGGVLAATEGLESDDADEIARIIDAMPGAVPPLAGEASRWDTWRPAGPVAVSAWTAPAAVLMAVARAGGAEEAVAASFAAEVELARRSGTLNRARLAQAASAAGVIETQQNRLVRLVSVRPRLWEVALVMEMPGSTQRFRGVLLMARRGEPAVGTPINERSGLLTWRAVDTGEAIEGLDSSLGQRPR